MKWHSPGDGDDAFSEGGISTTFRDVLLNMAGAMILIAAVLLGLVSRPGDESAQGSALPGNIVVESFWDGTLDTDVDQIVRGPEGDPVMYSNLVGPHYNLLRDDLGKMKDDPVNYEVTYSRGIPHGEHCVNLHLYSNRSGRYPIAVKVNVRIDKGEPGKTAGKKKPSTTLSTDVALALMGEEKNVFCFFVDKRGDLIEGQTYHSETVRLRSPEKDMP